MGFINNYLSLSYTNAGLIIQGSENWNLLPYGLTSSEKPQSEEIRADNQQSGFVGSHWQLAKVDIKDNRTIVPVIHNHRDTLDLSDEYALWGELRFTRTGCIVHLEQNEAFREVMSLINDGFSHVYYSWEPTSSGVRLTKGENTIFDAVIHGGSYVI